MYFVYSVVVMCMCCVDWAVHVIKPGLRKHSVNTCATNIHLLKLSLVEIKIRYINEICYFNKFVFCLNQSNNHIVTSYS